MISQKDKLKRASSRSAFTLIELSIVLVIIGLIVGGILVGRTLIGSAQARSQMKQMEEFQTAANTFKVKYNALPGDISPTDATNLGLFTFTGTYAGRQNLIDVGMSGSWGYLRCGFGDGSGDIQYSESYVFWQHLSQAKLVAGEFGGNATTGYIDANADGNSCMTGTGGGVPVNLLTLTGDQYNAFLPQAKTRGNVTVNTSSQYSNIPQFTGLINTSYFGFSATPAQISSIDFKKDDGLPTSGMVRVYQAVGCISLVGTVYQYDMSTKPEAYVCNAQDFWR